MMKKLTALIWGSSLLLLATPANAGPYCDGFRDGFKDGYCYGYHSCNPRVPDCPIPHLGDSGYDAGYKRGYDYGRSQR
jgi:hypothetical protein